MESRCSDEGNETFEFFTVDKDPLRRRQFSPKILTSSLDYRILLLLSRPLSPANGTFCP
jgi:hypothetical protein